VICQIFLAFCSPAGFGTFIQEPFFVLAGGFCNQYANARENLLIQRHQLLVRHFKQAIDFYHWSVILHLGLVIADKNKPLTLLSQPSFSFKTINI
jgi:hypothetical protein